MAEGRARAAWDHTATLVAAWVGGKPQDYHPLRKRAPVPKLSPDESREYLKAVVEAGNRRV